MLFFERAQRALDGGQVNHGLIWLVECWRYSARADDVAWQNLARANLAFWRYNSPEIKGVFSHGANIGQVAFSPDGKTILISSDGESARLWDAASCMPIGQPIPNKWMLAPAIFSPDGKIVLAGSTHKAARLWDATNGQAIGKPLEHQSYVKCAAFSPDGTVLITGGDDAMARLWDTTTGQPIGEPIRHSASVGFVAFSPNGRTVLTMGDRNGMARLWDAATRQPVGVPMKLQSLPSATAFIPASKTIWTGSGNHMILLWDVATGRPIVGKPLRHEGTVDSIAYSPDGKTVLTSIFQGDSAQLWDAASWLPIGRPLAHNGWVRAVAFSPDGRTVLTGSSDGTARFWDAATGEHIGQPIVHPSAVASVAYSPDGKTVITGGGNQAWLSDTPVGAPTGQPLLLQHRSVTSLAYSPDGRTVLTTGMNSLSFWDANNGLPVGRPMVDEHWVRAAAFGPDCKTILAVSEGCTARLWDIANSRFIGQPVKLGRAPTRRRIGYSGEPEGIMSARFSPDGKMVLTFSLGRVTTLWDATSGKSKMSESDINSATFGPDGKTVLTGGKDKTARLWDTANGQPLGAPMKHHESVAFVAFSPDGKTILTGSGGTATFWDPLTAEPIGKPIANPQGVSPIAFSPDGKTILATTGPFTLRLWDIATGRNIGQPMVHPLVVTSAVFSPSGTAILTGSADKKARLWDAATGQLVGPSFAHQGSVVSLVFSRDSKSIVTADNALPNSFDRQSAARLWHLPAAIGDDLPRIKTWIEIITGLVVDDQGNIRILDSDSWCDRRERLQSLGGPPPTDSGWLFDQILYGPDPTVRARAWMERQQWAEAEAAFDEVVRTHPLLIRAWVERGRFNAARSKPAHAASDFARALDVGYSISKLLNEIAAKDAVVDHLVRLLPARATELLLARAQHRAKQGQWDLAAADYREAGRRVPLDPLIACHHVTTLLADGDRDGLQRACSEVLARFDRTTDASTANDVAWSLALAPGAFADRGASVRLAEIALKTRQGARDSVLNTLGATLYRADRFGDAVRRLEEGIQLRNGESLPTNWPFLAMAHFRLGHRDEAHRWLDRLRNHQPSADANQFWRELEIRLLRCEAEAVILYDPVFPTNPFAH